MKILLMTALLLVTCGVQAKPEVIMQTTSSWDGGEITYPDGQAKITAMRLHLEADADMPFHCHPVPTFGYLVKGNLKVETKGGKTVILKEGDPVVEVMGTVHKGTPVNGPVEILVFYAGAQDVPNTVFPENDPDHKFCYAY